MYDFLLALLLVVMLYNAHSDDVHHKKVMGQAEGKEDAMILFRIGVYMLLGGTLAATMALLVPGLGHLVGRFAMTAMAGIGVAGFSLCWCCRRKKSVIDTKSTAKY